MDIKDEICKITNKYGDDNHYILYRETEDNEIRMDNEIRLFLSISKIKGVVDVVDAYDSCGYDCSVLYCVWINENDELDNLSILLENY
ncbi:hypothetical protein [Clostridium botulinum]|uniref:hypothetical protein n=1 Tax=Clostridium botulinum TaxID=1491 RepID=UPI001C9A9C1A|nr:hypothetical protein [Clostridium botulinum]MBY6838642.1 hypothetical protein [Clostridium botulinum]